MKLYRLFFAALFGLLLVGCKSEDELKGELEVKDCQSSVFSILNSGYTALMSDNITIHATDSDSEKLRLSEEVCKAKNPMYFK